MRYVLEIFPPNDPGYTPVNTLESPVAFGPMAKGDLISVDCWVGTARKNIQNINFGFKNGPVLRIVDIRHSFIADTSGLISEHKIGIATVAEENVGKLSY